MPNYRLDIEYEGTDFCGWQTQKTGRSVQEEMEKVLGVLLGRETSVVGAGRTDAGVHALGQVAHFFSLRSLETDRFKNSLNGLLPKDVTIHSVAEVPDDFHARFSAISREYRYHIRTGLTAVNRHFCWVMQYPVDWKAVKDLLPLVKGSHDFHAFCSSRSSLRNRECQVHSFSLATHGNEILFHISANRFVHKMVRSLVGTMIDIGRGWLPQENLALALRTGDRRLVGQTAPAKGLFLVKVGY